TRQRRIAGARSLQHTFDLAYCGILGKDDTFEVVFNPGTDKVEKQCLGPVPALVWDTGWGKPATAQPFIPSTTELIDSIVAVRVRQFSVPLGEGARRGDANLRGCGHAMQF